MKSANQNPRSLNLNLNLNPFPVPSGLGSNKRRAGVEKAEGEVGDRRYRQVLLRDRRAKKRQGVNSRLLRRCLRVEGMDALIKVPDPASLLMRMDIS